MFIIRKIRKIHCEIVCHQDKISLISLHVTINLISSISVFHLKFPFGGVFQDWGSSQVHGVPEEVHHDEHTQDNDLADDHPREPGDFYYSKEEQIFQEITRLA